MKIDFQSPIYPVASDVQQVFVEILNLILLAGDIAELERLLHSRDSGKRLSTHFQWSFAGFSFTLWQRMKIGSVECFLEKIMEVKHVSLVCQDKYKRSVITN